MKRAIYVVGYGTSYANWMQGTEFVDAIHEADLVVFTGGEDINPALYFKSKHPTTHYNERRDSIEVGAFRLAVQHQKPMIGICRGAQLLCAMSGGMLIQDQACPTFFHDITTSDGKTLPMTSMHHQACYPWLMDEKDYDVLAWTKGESQYHDLTRADSNVDAVYKQAPCLGREVEIIHFPVFRALGIQGHPEMMFSRCGYHDGIKESIDYCRYLLTSLINNTL